MTVAATNQSAFPSWLWNIELGINLLCLTRLAFSPKSFGHCKWSNPEGLPPYNFLGGVVRFTMVGAAKRDRKFIANFAAESLWLSKPQMMSVARLPATD